MSVINKIPFLSIYSWLLIVLCVLLPIQPKFTAPILIAYAVFWLLEGKFKTRFSLLKQEKQRNWLFIPVAYYILHIIGMAYSSNISFGLFDLQVKLPLLILPLFFAIAPKELFNTKNVNKYFIGFIAGCVFYGIYTLSLSAYQYIINPGTPIDIFFNSPLSRHIHPGYAALFTSMGAALGIYLLPKATKTWRILLTIATVFLFGYTVILSAKAGIITLAFVFLWGVIYLLKGIKMTKQKWAFLSVFILFFAIAGIYGLKNIPVLSSRVEEVFVSMRDVEASSTTTGIRVKLWGVGLDLIPQYFLIGTGTGDIKDVFVGEYYRQDIKALMTENFNPHCQFLQSFLALGILGLLLSLAFLVVVPIYLGIKNKYPLLLLFTAIAFVNCFVESMVERQGGVMFFTLFYCIFIMNSIFLKQSKKATTE